MFLPRKRVLITAGGTREPIDDVRVVANSSTGRLGLALAKAWYERGADVTLLGARSMAAEALRLPADIRFEPYDDTASLGAALDRLTQTPPDVLMMAAAVADYTPTPAEGKLRSDAASLTVHMTRTPKLLAQLRDRCPDTTLVGFKLLSGVDDAELIRVARRQRAENRLDWTVANDARRLSADQHPALLVGEDVLAVDGDRDHTARALVDAIHGSASPDPDAPRPPAGAWRRWRRLPTGALVYPPPERRPGRRERQRLEDPQLDAASAAVLVVGEALWWAGPDHDAALLDAACERGAPILWHGKVVGAIDGQRVWVGEDRAWIPDLLDGCGPLDLGPDVDWTELGWRRDGALFVPPWRHGDTLPAASVVCRDVTTGQVLMGRRLSPPLFWSVPGGRSEPGETPLQTALRELREETGVDVGDAKPIASWRSWFGSAPTWALTTFLVPTWGAPTPTPTPELLGRWCSVPDALRLSPLGPGARRVLVDLA